MSKSTNGKGKGRIKNPMEIRARARSLMEKGVRTDGDWSEVLKAGILDLYDDAQANIMQNRQILMVYRAILTARGQRIRIWNATGRKGRPQLSA